MSNLRCLPVPDRVRPPIDHFNYDELHNCPCHLCEGERRLGAEAQDKRILLEEEGERFGPDVPPEKRYEPISIAFLAQSNRRDLYSELSWLTQGRGWRAQFLRWVLDRIEDHEWHGEPWWAWRSQTRTLGSWIKEWYDTDPAFVEA